MTDSPLQKKPDSAGHQLWKWLLLTLCAAGAMAQIAFAIDLVGLGGHSWYGIWGIYNFPAGRPYVERFDPPQPGLAAERAGIRAGDWMDLREQSLKVRIGSFVQPMAMQPLSLVIHRGMRKFSVSLIPSTFLDALARTSLPGFIAGFVWSLWFIASAFLITSRRAAAPEARLLAATLVCVAGVPTGWAGTLVVPSEAATLFLCVAFLVISQVIAPLLLVVLSARFGARLPWRVVLESCAYAAIVLVAIELAAFVFGLVTLRIDPTKYGFGPGLLSPLSVTTLLYTIVGVSITLVAAVAVAATGQAERPRAAWLLLPLPLLFLVASIGSVVGAFVHTWSAIEWLGFVSNLVFILCAFSVTYALLKRRVLDFEFVLSRTLVVAAVSLLVVATFVFLEWFLGSVLAGVSRVTGFIANAALALVLGISLRYIHRRAEAFVTSVIFRKRYDDERALRDFSKEAAYVTEPNVLLDQAIATIARHTDARSGALLLETDGAYVPSRSFGDNISKEIDENDPAILAMKAWHKPLDPHHYQTALRGALAFPMLARGRLNGILLLGERTGGEAYAPDEVESFSEVAHGVGSAFDALASNSKEPLTALRDAIASMQAAIIDELRTKQRSVDSQSL